MALRFFCRDLLPLRPAAAFLLILSITALMPGVFSCFPVAIAADAAVLLIFRRAVSPFHAVRPCCFRCQYHRRAAGGAAFFVDAADCRRGRADDIILLAIAALQTFRCFDIILAGAFSYFRLTADASFRRLIIFAAAIAFRRMPMFDFSR